MNFLRIALAVFVLLPLWTPAAPRISEFMARNDETIADEDGDFSDWLEIHNPDGAPYDLSGCFLTDDPDRPAKWQFPATTQIAADGYLIVFASDKNRSVAGSELHTGFKLSSNAGSYIALVAGMAEPFSVTTPTRSRRRISVLESPGRSSRFNRSKIPLRKFSFRKMRGSFQ